MAAERLSAGHERHLTKTGVRMAAYLLRLSIMDLAAPGILDVVFGKDGDHENAHYWTGQVLDIHPSGHRGFFHVTKILSGRFADVLEIAPMMDLHDLALDCRVFGVRARLMRLCSMVQDIEADITPEALAALTLDLAPKIAALKTST